MTGRDSSGPSVAAIVVTYHTGPRLTECLYALAVHSGVGEIIIVDNGNPAQMTDWLRKFEARVPKATYLETGENIGFGSAVNRGAGQAQVEQLLIINPDCLLRPDALLPLQAAAIDQPSPWMIGGRIFNLQGIAQRGPKRAELTLGRVFSKLLGGAGINLPLEPQPENPVPVDVTSGAFFLIDKAGFDHLGGFDEGYFLHVEDIDLAKRVHVAGGAVLYQPLAGALHFGATSNVSSLFVERHKAAGFARYFRKFAKGPFHRLLVELCLPFIYSAFILRALIGGQPKPR